jgi:hypothetical protein
MAKTNKKDLETFLLEKKPSWDEIMAFLAGNDHKVKEDK